MKNATQPLRDFATYLRAYEMRVSKIADFEAPFHITNKLQSPLTTFMGRGGYRALVSRALALAAAEVPWLKELSITADGDLDGWATLTPQLEPSVGIEGEVVLLAHLFGLLAAFIGEILTLRLVHEIWPNLPLGNVDLGIGAKNET